MYPFLYLVFDIEIQFIQNHIVLLSTTSISFHCTIWHFIKNNKCFVCIVKPVDEIKTNEENVKLVKILKVSVWGSFQNKKYSNWKDLLKKWKMGQVKWNGGSTIHVISFFFWFGECD